MTCNNSFRTLYSTENGEEESKAEGNWNMIVNFVSTEILRGGAPIRTNFPHFLTNLFKSNIFGMYVFKLEEARIFFEKNHTVAMATAAILENIGNFQIAKTFLPLGQ